MARKKNEGTPVDRLSQVVSTLYEILKKESKGQKVLYSALRKRVSDLADEAEDLDQVELVCRTIIDDTVDFSVWKNFNWVYYEFIRDSLEVPNGAWRYALWSYKTSDVQESVNFWLGEWMDADQIGDKKAIEKARNGLENLWMKHHNVKSLEESW